jgi:hypothetical protein
MENSGALPPVSAPVHAFTARFGVMICCPKCASGQGRSIEAVYCECSDVEKRHASEIARLAAQSAPPDRRHPRFWLLLTGAFLVLSVSGLLSLHEGAAPLALCAGLSGWMSHEALRYNRADLPRLLEYWHRSFICMQCGEVYVPG